VKFVENVHSLDVFSEGRKLRNNNRLEWGGVNVNFVETTQGELFVRTYERGVEDETLSCGTGVTASAIAAGIRFGKSNWAIETPGGRFNVDYHVEEWGRSRVWLRGPAELICKAEVNLIG
jgi:diaminopimelate epimerase